MKTTFKEHDIVLTTDFRFRVTGPTFDAAIEYSSIDDARNGINQRALALAQQRKAEAGTALPALDDNGERVIVRGVNSTNGMLLGVKTPSVYPDVPWIKDVLARRATLAAELTAIDKKLTPYRTGARVQYGRVRLEDYEAVVRRLAADMNARTEKAKENQ